MKATSSQEVLTMYNNFMACVETDRLDIANGFLERYNDRVSELNAIALEYYYGIGN